MIRNPALLLFPLKISRLYEYNVELEIRVSILFYIWLVNITLALVNVTPLLITDGSYPLLRILERLKVQEAPRIALFISSPLLLLADAAPP